MITKAISTNIATIEPIKIHFQVFRPDSAASVCDFAALISAETTESLAEAEPFSPPTTPKAPVNISTNPIVSSNKKPLPRTSSNG